jgi:hypothetical protein
MYDDDFGIIEFSREGTDGVLSELSEWVDSEIPEPLEYWRLEDFAELLRG